MNMKKTHSVNITSWANYDIAVGRNNWDKLSALRDELNFERLFIVIDENVHEYHGDYIEQALQPYCQKLFRYILPAGESQKSIGEWSKIMDFFLQQRVQRHTPILAIGGGVTGDLAGFVASTLLRGIPLIHLPTTLLAMVDSSIGGKTGVNHQVGKNMIGTFYQPKLVLADTEYLTTLPENEWINGISEILKYGCIREPALIEDMAGIINKTGFEPTTDWQNVISRCAQIKANVVQEDVEEKGVRAILNFGHTFAHALEAEAGYGELSHGEAVYAGMIAALYVSRENGASVSPDSLLSFKNLYQINWNERLKNVDALLARMLYDKKTQENNIHLVLLDEWGSAVVQKMENQQIIRDGWQFMFDQLD